MKKITFVIIFVLLVILQINAQKINFPHGLISYDAKPLVPLFGQVKTVLTVSYIGDEVSETTVETYNSEKKKQEFISQKVGIEIHSGEMLPLVNRKYYAYVEGNNLSKVLSYEADGELLGETVFNLDSKGRLVEEIGYSSDGKIFYRIAYEYVTERREIAATYTTYYEKGSLTERIILLYNEKEQWTKRTPFDKYGKQKDSMSFEYNETGFLTKAINCCKYNFLYTYKYKFDKHGNWIEKVEFYSQKDATGNMVTREKKCFYRVISYYSDTIQE